MNEKVNYCQTCLSNDRFLHPLSKINVIMSALNLELMAKDGGVCWECARLMQRFSQFKLQALHAQRDLFSNQKSLNLKSLSTLSYGPKDVYDAPNYTAHWSKKRIKQEIVEPNDSDVSNKVVESAAPEENGLDCDNVRSILDEIDQHLSQISNDSEVSNANRVMNKANGSRPEKNGPCSIGLKTTLGTEHLDIWSELPRITLVQSQVDNQESEPTVDDDVTEIIELNIPLPYPILVEDDSDGGDGGDGGDGKAVNSGGDVRTNEMAQEVTPIVTVKQEVVSVDDSHETVVADQRPSTDLICKQEMIEGKIDSCTTFEARSRRELGIWKRSVMLVYNRFRSHKHGFLFTGPITDDAAPEYSRIVKRPMDLNTIRRNVRSGVIRTTSQFKRDILLMLSNALMYNSRDHCVYEMAKDLHEEAVQLLESPQTKRTSDASKTSPVLTRLRRCMRRTDTPTKGLHISVVKQEVLRPPGNADVFADVEETVPVMRNPCAKVCGEAAKEFTEVDNTSVHVVKTEIEDESDMAAVEDQTFIDNAKTVNVECKREMIDSNDNLDTGLTISPGDSAEDHQVWKRSVMLVYNRLRVHKYSSRFLHPISDDAAPEYSRIVKRPMDLNTIRRNVRSGVIRTTAQFQRDVLLMLSNALMYNSRDHCVYEMALDLHEEVNYQLGVLLTVQAQSVVPDNTPTRPRRNLTRKEHSRHHQVRSHQVRIKTEKLGLNPIAIGAEANKSLNTSRVIKSECTVQTKSNKRQNTDDINTACSDGIKKTRKSQDTEQHVARKIKNEPCHEDMSKRKKTHSYKFTENWANMKCVAPSSRGLPLANVTIKSEKSIYNADKSVAANSRTVQSVAATLPTFKSCNLCVHDTTDAHVTVKTEKKLKVKIKKETPLKDDLCVAITNITFRDLTRDQSTEIKRTLEEKILQIASNSRKFAPKFRGVPIIAEGVIKLWCDDYRTLQWLRDIVITLPDTLGRFKVVAQKDLPKKLRAALTIPSTESVDVIQKLLKAQNPWAHIDSWALYGAVQKGESMFFVVDIPSTVIPVLLARERRLSYNLGAVYVKFYSSKFVSEPLDM